MRPSTQSVTLVLAAFPFQINAVMPAGVGAGSTGLQVSSAVGTASQNVTIAGAAPGIFAIGTAANGEPLGAVVNQDGTVSTALNPSQRGQYISIYGTGLGATVAQGGLQVATTPVTVVLNGTVLKPSYAGMTPGIAGLYQVNGLVPAGTTPGVGTIAAQAGGETSNTVAVVLQ